MKCFVLLTVLAFASKKENDVESVAANSGENITENAAENSIVVKIEEDEYVKKRSSQFIGVSFRDGKSKWTAKRWSKKEKRNVNNGSYEDEETAARASDTLVRKLIANGEQNHKFNFPDDNVEVYAKPRKHSSKYIGVSYNEARSRWEVKRHSKTEHKDSSNGYYRDEETAAHASDTLGRKLMANGEQNLKLNFPDDNTTVHPVEKTKTSKFFGVTYNEQNKRWFIQRWSKIKKKVVNNGYHKDEETAAHASDTLAKKLMANGEQNHKLNFPDDNTEVHPQRQTNKRKRPFDFEDSQTDHNNFEE